MKNLIKALLLAVAMLGLASTGCEKKVDEAKAAAAETAEKVEDKVEDGAKKVEEAAEKVEEGADKVAAEVKEGAAEVKEAAEGTKEEPAKPATSGK